MQTDNLIKSWDEHFTLKLSEGSIKDIAEHQSRPPFRQFVLFQILEEIAISKTNGTDAQCRESLARLQILYKQLTWKAAAELRIEQEKNKITPPEAI